MSRRTVPFVFLLLLAGCAPAQTPSGIGAGRYVEHLTSGGLDRQFIVNVPKSYDRTTPTSVVVVLHGWTATAAMAEKYTRMAEEGEAQGFVSVFPDGINKGWNAGFIDLSGKKPDDVKFISDVLDHLESELKIDKTREYVCGHSNGAFMANYLGAELSTRLAAIGSVAGTIGVKAGQIPAPASPISAILIHGMQDEMVAYDQNSSAFLRGIGAEQSVEWWAQQDGCSLSPQKTVSPNGNAVTEVFSGGKNGTVVELVSIKNGRHSWPGGYFLDKNGNPAVETTTGVSAADLLWTFFKAHPKS